MPENSGSATGSSRRSCPCDCGTHTHLVYLGDILDAVDKMKQITQDISEA